MMNSTADLLDHPHLATSIQFWWSSHEGTTRRTPRWESHYGWALRAIARALDWSEPAMKFTEVLEVRSGTDRRFDGENGLLTSDIVSVALPMCPSAPRVLDALARLFRRRAPERLITIDATLHRRLAVSALLLPECVVKLDDRGLEQAARWERRLGMPVACGEPGDEGDELDRLARSRARAHVARRSQLLRVVVDRRIAMPRA